MKVLLTEAKCPTCGPRVYFFTHWETGDERHDIPCEIEADEMRGESHCACGEIVLMAFEPIRRKVDVT